MNWPMIALLALAASRAVHLVGDDLFPFGWLRDRLDTSKNTFANWLGHGMGCTFCLSVHAGFWAALLAVGLDWAPAVDGWAGLGIFVVLWFAIAQAIVLIEGLIFKIMED